MGGGPVIGAYGLRLFAQHAAMLEASGITPDHARARGYVTVDTKQRLEDLSITKAGRNVPGLLVPLLQVDGSRWGYQYRPDTPRLRDGKPVKYETPTGQRNGIDVPPGLGDALGDPAVPLWVTEGAKKADAAALAGLCCVALLGVWSWRGSNGHGGKTAIADWHDIALNGRRVVLAFDSDVIRKPAVRNALDQLADYLTSKSARVEYLHLPDDDESKTGLDDYLAAGHGVDDLWRLVRPEPPAVADMHERDIENGGSASYAKPREQSGATVEKVGDPEADLANARRLVAAYGDRLRYVVTWKKWHVWDGTRWKLDDTRAGRPVRQAARGHAARETQRWRSVPYPDRGRYQRHVVAGRYRTWCGVGAGFARCRPVPAQRRQRDRGPGQLRPHDPADLLTKICGAAYHPDAEAPEFAEFLQRIQPDEGMREFLARLFGHALLGKVVEHVLAILYGAGANGKTTLVEAVTAVFGDYARPVDPELLIERGDVHPTSTASLFGLRLAITHETEQGRRLAEATVKRLTGGDKITARRMREDFWDFDPSHSIVMHTNHKPAVRGTDEGIWRRLRFVPFPVVIPEDERDAKLPERLALEADGILAWLVAGYQAWQDRGLAEPERVTEATSAFRGESDDLGLFLTERCRLNAGPFATVQSSVLFAEWVKWAKRENVEPVGTQTAFSRAMLGRGHDKKMDGNGRMVWLGIDVYADETGE